MSEPRMNVVASRYLEQQDSEAAAQRLLRAGFEGAPFEELLNLQKWLAKMVPSMDAKTIAYGTYATQGFTQGTVYYVWDLRKAFLSAYRKHLIDWMKYALVKRANLGGGGTGIKKVERGLAEFVEAIPAILLGDAKKKLSDYLPDTEYFIADRLDPVGHKILGVVWKDAKDAGVLPATKQARAKRKFQVIWDDKDRTWYIPFDRYTYDYYDQLAMDGFKSNRAKKRWDFPKKNLSPVILRDYDVQMVPGAPGAPKPPPPPRAPKPEPKELAVAPSEGGGTPLHEWFFRTWLPANIDRFTKVFTDYASSAQSSYKIVFSVSGDKVGVKFQRDINTAAEAVEELRYRYTNRSGREPWLEVMDRYVELVRNTSPDDKLMLIIDRMNNLQHSNGLFMEHFPKDVQSWYVKFLNAKYNAPNVAALSRFIPDKDVKNLLLEMSHYLYEQGPGGRADFRPPGFQQQEPRTEYQEKGKELPPPDVNWRAKGYPLKPGTKPLSDRADSRVQHGLDVLREFDVAPDIIGNMDPEYIDKAVRLKRQGESLREDAKNAGNWVVMRRDDLGKGIPEDEIRNILQPVEAWVKEFQALAAQEPPLPTEARAARAYDHWLDQMERKKKDRKEAEKLFQEARKKLEAEFAQRAEEARLYQLETGGELPDWYYRSLERSQQRRAGSILRVAFRWLTSRTAA